MEHDSQPVDPEKAEDFVRVNTKVEPLSHRGPIDDVCVVLFSRPWVRVQGLGLRDFLTVCASTPRWKLCHRGPIDAVCVALFPRLWLMACTPMLSVWHCFPDLG